MPTAAPVIFTLTRSVTTTVLLLAVYLLILPVGSFGTGPYIVLAAGIVVNGVAISMQLRAIARSDRADLRAIEAVGILLPLIVIVFAGIYLEMSENNAANFTEPLTRVGSLYFAVTILSTVGFGDINAVTDVARLAVTFQMLADLVLVAALIRLIVAAIAHARGRTRTADTADSGGTD